MKQLGLAVHNYISAKKDVLPGGVFQQSNSDLPAHAAGSGSYQSDSFFVFLMPYMEQQQIYDNWKFTDRGKNSLTDTSPAATQIPMMLCPSDNPAEKVCYFPAAVTSANMAFPGYYAVTSYAGNHGTMNYYPTGAGCGPISTDDGMFYVWASKGSTSGVEYTHLNGTKVRPDHGVALKTVTDGTSKTLMFGEKYNEDPTFDAKYTGQSGLKIHQWSLWGWTGGFKGTGHVTRSGGITQAINRQSATCTLEPTCCQDERLRTWGSGHPGGGNFVMADASTQFISDSISPTTLAAISTRNGR